MKRYAITGSTSGIGLEVAKILNQAGHPLIMLNRSMEKAEAVKEQMANPDSVHLIECDLSDLSSVKAAAETIRSNYSQIDGLINNAGGIFPERQETPDGLELTFAINHLGHFLLTQKLMKLLKQGTDPQIINVSSEAHRQSQPNFDDLQMTREYQSFKAYANAKLFNIYFSLSLAELTPDNGIKANAVHPGFVSTGFGRDFKGIWKGILTLLRPFMINQQKGGENILHLIQEDAGIQNNAAYFKDKKPTKPAPIAFDEAKRQQLWEVSQELIKGF